MTLLISKIAPPEKRAEYNHNIEQYRGLCALLVILAHGLTHDILVKDFSWPAFMNYINAGYLSVLIFFCISGYAIGSSVTNNNFQTKEYVKKRIVRLYPIYIVSILMCIPIASPLSYTTVLENLFFLQNSAGYFGWQVPVFENFASWSLNYEMVYYLIFIPIVYLKPRVLVLVGSMLIISLISIQTNPNINFFIDYLSGFYFWLMGLIIAWLAISKNKPQSVNLLSLLFLHLCQNHLGIGKIILNTLHITSNSSVNWLFDLPFCFFILATLIGIKNKWTFYNKVVCYVFPFFVFLFLAIKGRLFENERWIMCGIFWILSVVLIKEKKLSDIIREKLTSIGEISYALYILHVPVALLIKKYIFINNKATEITIKYILWILVTFSLSYLLEKVWQPKIRNYFFKPTKLI